MTSTLTNESLTTHSLQAATITNTFASNPLLIRFYNDAAALYNKANKHKRALSKQTIQTTQVQQNVDAVGGMKQRFLQPTDTTSIYLIKNALQQSSTINCNDGIAFAPVT